MMKVLREYPKDLDIDKIEEFDETRVLLEELDIVEITDRYLNRIQSNMKHGYSVGFNRGIIIGAVIVAVFSIIIIATAF